MVAEHFHSQADEDDSRTSFQMKRGEPVQFAGQEKAGSRAEEGGGSNDCRG